MNIIDALFVTLGLDATGFTKGQKDAQEALGKTGKAARKQQKELDDAAKRTAESYKKVRDGILEITAAIIGAVAGKDFLQYLTANDAAVGRLSKNLGVATEELSAWEGVAKRLGASSGDADGMFRGVNKILEDIKLTGGSEALTPLARAGLDIGKFNDKATTYTQRLLMLSDALKKLTPQDAQRFGQQAGFSEESLNILLQTRFALGDLVDQQKKMNVVSKEDADIAMSREKAWNDLTETMVGFGRKIANEVTPALVSFLRGLQSVFGFLEQHVPYANGLLLALISTATVLTGFKLATWAAGWSGAMGVVGTAAATLMGRLGMLGIAAASLYEVYGLVKATIDLVQAKSRDGVTLSASAQGRLGDVAGFDPFHSGGGSSYSALEQAWGLPAGLLSAVKNQETGKGSGVGAVSSAGARGPFQFMPGTAAQYGLKNPDDPTESAAAAAHLLSDLLKRYGGNLPMALAAYNEGPGNLAKGYMPDETRGYINGIMGNMGAGQGGSGSTHVTTGDIHVHTAATDAKGIARDIGREMRNFAFASQANSGVN
jgi:hypothetical protein